MKKLNVMKQLQKMIRRKKKPIKLLLKNKLRKQRLSVKKSKSSRRKRRRIRKTLKKLRF